MRRVLSLFCLVWLHTAFAAGWEPEISPPAPVKIARVSVSNWQDGLFHFKKAIDGKLETSWGTGQPFKSKKEWIIFYLEDPTVVTSVDVAIGLQDNPGDFTFNGRPKTATLFFSDGSQQELKFDDEMGYQTCTLRPVRTRWIKMQINTIYPGARNPNTKDFGLAEMVVYGADIVSLQRFSGD